MQVTTLCSTSQQGEELMEWLHKRGYRKEEISVIFHDEAQRAQNEGSLSEEQAMRHALPLAGAAAGISVLGSVAGTALLAGTTSLTAAGPLMLLLAGTGILAGAGIVGVLEGAGIPHDDAERYADELQRGGMLVSVTPRPHDEQAVRDFFARFRPSARASR